VLYTNYLFPFQLAGLILLVAMIGSILLTLRTREGVRKQHAGAQISRTRAEGVKLMKVTTGAGIDGHTRS
jgi:NADH-quinone oxidoreductase subunit J